MCDPVLRSIVYKRKRRPDRTDEKIQREILIRRSRKHLETPNVSDDSAQSSSRLLKVGKVSNQIDMLCEWDRRSAALLLRRIEEAFLSVLL